MPMVKYMFVYGVIQGGREGGREGGRDLSFIEAHADNYTLGLCRLYPVTKSHARTHANPRFASHSLIHPLPLSFLPLNSQQPNKQFTSVLILYALVLELTSRASH